MSQACFQLEAAEPDTGTDWDEFEIKLAPLEKAIKSLAPSTDTEAELVNRLNLYLNRLQTNLAEVRVKKGKWIAARDKSWYEFWVDPDEALADYRRTIQTLHNSLASVKRVLPAHGKTVSEDIGRRIARLHDPNLDKEAVAKALDRFSGQLNTSLTGVCRAQVDVGDEAIGQGMSAIFEKSLTPAVLMTRYEGGK